MKTETLADKLGTTHHVSPLLMKLKRRGLASPRDVAGAAVARGCRHYQAYASARPTALPDISDEELAIALLSPANPYDPMLIRIGGQMLSGTATSPERLVRLAGQERCSSILKYIAECGCQTEPTVLFWKRILAGLDSCKAAPIGVMPHPSRFRSETGVTSPKDAGKPKVQWLRPLPLKKRLSRS
jgi:hypothetical protein